jgi:hypothetical protein
MYHAFDGMGIQLVYKHSIIMVNIRLKACVHVVAEEEGLGVEINFDVHK